MGKDENENDWTYLRKHSRSFNKKKKYEIVKIIITVIV